MTQHSALTGADLHEPKGAASATRGQVYVANGAGSGAWKDIGALTTRLDDVSAPSSVYLVIPYDCAITKISTCLQTAITGANSTLTVYNHAGSSMGTITVAYSGSAAGDVDTLSPVSNNTFTAGQVIRIATDGASSTTSVLTITIEYDLV